VLVDDVARTDAVLLDVAQSAEVARLGPHRGLNQCPSSPDGRWVATATRNGKDVKVWEVATGRLVWEFPCASALVRFSPDGRWLAVFAGPTPECRLWHVGSWHPGPAIRGVRGTISMAFSRDGRLFAIDDGGRVRLVDPDSGREIVMLDAGTGSLANFFCLALSPDGSQLAAGRDHIIHLWDLRRIRKQLARLGLDWASPPYPPPAKRLPLGPVVLVPPVDDHAKEGPIIQAPVGLRLPAGNNADAPTPEAWKRP
jgi:WD40 repeat protein